MGADSVGVSEHRGEPGYGGASVPTGVGAALGASTHPAPPRGPGRREPRAGSASSVAPQPASASARSFFQLRVARELPHLQTKGDSEVAGRLWAVR